MHGWNIDNRGRYYCTLQFPNGSVSTYGEGEVSPYQHKGMRFTEGGGVDGLPNNLKKRLDNVNKNLTKYGGRPLTEEEAIMWNVYNNSQSGFDAGMKALDLSGARNYHYESKRLFHSIGDALIDISRKMTGVEYDNYEFRGNSDEENLRTYNEKYKGTKFTEGGKIEYNQYGVPQGYLYLTEFANFDRKGSGELKDVAVTILEDNFLEEQDYEGQQIHAYLHDLPYFVDYETEIPRYNPTSPVNDEPMTDNYLLLVPIEEGDEDLYNNGVYFRTYFVDTQGYDYPRYITRLENYFPSDEQVEELGYMKRGGRTRKLNHGGDIYDRYSMRSGDSINNKYGR